VKRIQTITKIEEGFFMNSIRRILATVCALALAFSLTAAQAEDVTIEKARFSPYDMNVNYVYLHASKDEAQAVFPNLLGSETTTSAATGETEETWNYSGMNLTFSGEGKLIGADVTSAAYTGPRGIKVGMTALQVFELFYMDPKSTTSSLFYSAGYVEAFAAQLPPCGYVQCNDDGTFDLMYLAPLTAYGDDVLANPTDFVYQNTAQFTVHFDSTATVTGFSWRLSPMAE
jgi:hypothetical protein